MNAVAVAQNASWPRSVGAVFAGFVFVVVLSLLVDQVLHVLQVYPPWGQPMRETSDNLLALSYRTLFNVGGGWLTARLSPRHPARHVGVLAGVGFVLATLGAIATVPMDLGPAWYPIALALTAVPSTLLGLVLPRRR
jgi:hypothetical protein